MVSVLSSGEDDEFYKGWWGKHFEKMGFEQSLKISEQLSSVDSLHPKQGYKMKGLRLDYRWHPGNSKETQVARAG